MRGARRGGAAGVPGYPRRGAAGDPALCGLRPAQSAPLLRCVGAHGARGRRGAADTGAALDDAPARSWQAKILYTGCERHRTLLRSHRRFRGNGGGDHGAAALRARARAGRTGAAGLLRRDVSARARGGAPHDGTLWARDDVEPFADQARGQRR